MRIWTSNHCSPTLWKEGKKVHCMKQGDIFSFLEGRIHTLIIHYPTMQLLAPSSGFMRCVEDYSEGLE